MAEENQNEQVENNEQNEQQEEQQETMYTQSDLDRHISKAVDSALKKQRAKLEQEIEERIESERKEAERLAKLSEKERKEEEMTKREKEIADRLAELERRELKADAVSDLKDKGLPADFADFLLAENAEKTLENINAFKTAFDEAVKEAVKEKLRQDTPKLGGGTSTPTNPWSKEHRNLTEQARIMREDPELAKRMQAQAKE